VRRVALIRVRAQRRDGGEQQHDDERARSHDSITAFRGPPKAPYTAGVKSTIPALRKRAFPLFMMYAPPKRRRTGDRLPRPGA
jgi:hypothetical protein